MRVSDDVATDSKLAEVVRRLVEAHQPECIYLFGSMARGEAGPYSDYDLLVVVPDDAPPERYSSKLAYETLWGTGTAADVIVWERSRFDRRAHVVCSCPPRCCAKGGWCMPHDPELVSETRAWLVKADHDLRAGEVDLVPDPPLTMDVVFHTQQAVEKAMKAFLTWHSRPFRKTHNLTEIGGLSVAVDVSLEPLFRRADRVRLEVSVPR